MKRNFECLKCHHKFIGDDTQDIVCPQCNSDNVRPVEKSKMTAVLYAALFVAALAIGFFCIKSFKTDSSTTVKTDQNGYSVSEDRVIQEPIETPADNADSPTEEMDKPKDITIQEKKIDEEAAKIPVKQPVTLAIKTPKAEADGTYSFSTNAEHLPAGVSVTRYVLETVNTKTEVATSTTGQFAHVPASTDKGMYNLRAELSDGQNIVRDRIGGFDKVEKVEARMTAEELTNLLNSMNKDLGLGKNSRVIKKPVIVIENSSDVNDKQVTLIDDIFSRLEFGSWTQVTVTNVSYDAQGKINKFTISVSAN